MDYIKKRLTLDINTHLHKRIKITAAKRNVSMLTWIVRVIIKELEKEKGYD